MKIKSLFLILGAVLGLVLTTLSAIILFLTGYFQTVTLMNQDSCKTKITFRQAIQDLEIFHSKYLIGGSDDKLELFQGTGIEEAQNGKLVYIRLHIQDIKRQKIRQVNMIGFPESVRFQPHGIFLDKTNDLLYVINHAYKYGGQRVDVFLISEKDDDLQAEFKTTIQFDDDKLGLFNDLMVHNGYLYITQWLSFPDNKEGRDHSISASFRRTWNALTKRGDNIYKCKITSIDQDKVPKFESCELNVKGVMKLANGITSDKKSNRVWVSDSADKTVHYLEVSSENGDLVPKDVIQLKYGVDNLQYEQESDSVLLSTVLRAYEYIQFQRAAQSRNTKDLYITSGGSELIYKDGKLKQIVDLFKQRTHSGTSIVKRWRVKEDKKTVNYYFLGSWHDRGLGICQIQQD